MTRYTDHQMVHLDEFDWRQRAACRNVHPETFFPPGRSDSPKRQQLVEIALAVCHPCTVRTQCAAQVLRRRRGHGVVAGVDLGSGINARFLGTAERLALQKVAGVA